MDAQVVYQVAKALPKEEQQLLLDILEKDFRIVLPSKSKKKKRQLITNEQAVAYLIKNVFSKKILF